MRQEGDVLADKTVAALFAGGGIPSVNSVWGVLLKNDQIPPEDLPAEVVDYFKQSSQLPNWADRKLIEQGEQFFTDHGLFCLASLLCASLPECYVMKKAARVLVATQRLEGPHAYRRLFETAQMVVAVMSPGGLAEKGGGIRTVQKVRLMHAAIRHLILEPAVVSSEGPKDFTEVLLRMSWDPTELGKPINQEDMAYTLLTFSYVILRSVKKMGIAVTHEDAKAYLHCWKVVGYLMGLDEQLLTDDFHEAKALFEQIKARQEGESKAGCKLTTALENATAQIFSHSTQNFVPRWFFRPVPTILMRQLLKKKTEEMLGLKKLTVREWIGLNLLRLFERFASRCYGWLLCVFGRRFGMVIVGYLTQMDRGHKRGLFFIPEHLQIHWRVKPKKKKKDN